MYSVETMVLNFIQMFAYKPIHCCNMKEIKYENRSLNVNGCELRYFAYPFNTFFFKLVF